MAAEPKTTPSYDLPDFQAVLDRITAANRKAGNDYLDLLEKTVSQVATWQLKAADAAKVPAVTELVQSQVDVAREITGTYVKTARELINH
jgi:hypothetical protein